MRLQKKLLVIALACAFPLGSAFAQSAADLKKEIEALKAQLQLLQKKVEDISQAADITPLTQQVNRMEQKMDLADNAAEASGFQGMKINGVIETNLSYNTLTVAALSTPPRDFQLPRTMAMAWCRSPKSRKMARVWIGLCACCRVRHLSFMRRPYRSR